MSRATSRGRGAWIGVLLVLLPLRFAAAAAPVPLADGWSSWEVALQPGSEAPCCAGAVAAGRGCRLEDNLELRVDGSEVHAGHGTDADGGRRLRVYVHQQAGRTVAIRAYAADCPVHADSTIHALAGVDGRASLDWLAARSDGPPDSLADAAQAAIAFHAGAAATRYLAGQAGAGRTLRVREQALFWLGQTRGEAGLPAVLAAADADSPRLRRHALFVLSQSPLPQARQVLRERTRRDPSAQVRGQGLFWLAQVDDPETWTIGRSVLADPARTDEFDATVFALGQLPRGRGDDALIALIEGDYARAVKKRALFWLGQSGSDKALRFLDRLLAASS